MGQLQGYDEIEKVEPASVQTPQQPKTTSPERIKEYDRVISELNSLMSKERDPKIKAEINEAISRYTKEKNNIK